CCSFFRIPITRIFLHALEPTLSPISRPRRRGNGAMRGVEGTQKSVRRAFKVNYSSSIDCTLVSLLNVGLK
ncbi:MAG: hypothetical protein JZU65_24055, partial [Chlorobium sp.]|nr:hypothetical protein [Chlorobium sp.]